MEESSSFLFSSSQPLRPGTLLEELRDLQFRDGRLSGDDALGSGGFAEEGDEAGEEEGRRAQRHGVAEDPFDIRYKKLAQKRHPSYDLFLI